MSSDPDFLSTVIADVILKVGAGTGSTALGSFGTTTTAATGTGATTH